MRRQSHKLIDGEAALAAEQVGIITEGLRKERARKELLRWVKFFDRNARVIRVTVENEQTAYVVFETMNDRGLELSAVDLIKNHLFGVSGSRLNQTKHHWSSMIGILESVESSEIVKDYVRHYWISFHGKTRAPVLFAAIKKETKNPNSCVRFASALADTAPQYTALINREHPFWNSYGNEIRQHVETLGDFGLRQMRPLLLSVLRKFPKNEVRKAFRLAVSWSVRLMAVGLLGRGALESDYGVAALGVENKEIRSAEELARSMRSVIPTDDIFAANFADISITKESLAKYVLRALEIKARGRRDNLDLPDEKATSVDHVLPKKPKVGEWPFTPEEHDEYLYRLGNLVLCGRMANSDLGNVKFSVKRPILETQPFRLTKQVGAVADWTKEKIEARQKTLAALAVKAWSLNAG